MDEIQSLSADEYILDDRRILRNEKKNWLLMVAVDGEWVQLYATASLVRAWRFLKGGRF